MNDAFVVSGSEGLGERRGDVEDAVGREPARRNQPVERLAIDQLHREKVDAVRFLD